MAELPLRCACGKIHGTLRQASRKTASHLRCYCRDCQAFGRFLERDGLLDAWGGTTIFHVAPVNVKLEAEEGALACLRLSPKGLYRWHCAECKTPLGNTPRPGIPLVGLMRAFIDHPSPEDVLGPLVGSGWTKSARNGGPPEPEHAARTIARSLRLMLQWKLTGKSRPSPFWDENDRPRATPRVLTRQERKRFSN